MEQKTTEKTESGKINLKHLQHKLTDLTGHLIFWSIAIGGLLLDLWTKKAVFAWLEQREYVSVVDGFIKFIRTENDGAAFSIFSGKSTLLAAISFIAFILIIAVFLFSRRQPRIFQIALGFFAAGVSGNLYDRAFNNGNVRDFVDVYFRFIDYHWPTFNVADSLLCIGVGLLIISTVFIPTPSQKHDLQQK